MSASGVGDDVWLVLDGAEGSEAEFEFADYVEGDGTARYFRVSASTDLDFCSALLPIADAAQLRDWLTEALKAEDIDGDAHA